MSPGLRVHPLGVTCAAESEHSSPDDADLLAGLRHAVERGATLLDTADSHGNGHAERVIGRFLRECSDDSLIQLSSRVGRVRGSAPHPYAGRHIHHQYEQSVENLYAEGLALYSLDSLDFGRGDCYLGTAIDTMITLKKLKAIRAIGMRGPSFDYRFTSRQAAAHLERFLYLFYLIKPDVIWTPVSDLTLSVLLEGEDLFTFTAKRGVGLLLAAPTPLRAPGGQALNDAAFWNSRAGFETGAAETMATGFCALQARFGTAPDTLARLGLRYGLQRGEHCAVVASFSTEHHVEEAFSDLARPLTRCELEFVDEIYANFRSCIRSATDRPPSARVRV
ncbi:aldo/keto reductase [Streptomyces sp. NPDC004237]|uniref:aldo/keto reductase n=1 Tax=Streptomyces sp. NPDC004237 TaxID=3154455 RepID=UPI00339E7764